MAEIRINGKIVLCDKCDKNATHFIGTQRLCSSHASEVKR